MSRYSGPTAEMEYRRQSFRITLPQQPKHLLRPHRMEFAVQFLEPRTQGSLQIKEHNTRCANRTVVKINKLQSSFWVQYAIFWLQVPMNKSISVQMRNAACEISHKNPRTIFRKNTNSLQALIQITSTKKFLHQQQWLWALQEEALGIQNIQQLHNVVMLQEAPLLQHR